MRTFPLVSHVLFSERAGFDAVDLPPLSPDTVAGAAPVFHRLPCCLVRAKELVVFARTHYSSVKTHWSWVLLAVGRECACRQGLMVPMNARLPLRC